MLPKYEEELKSLVIKLFEINAFKFGNFKLKSGVMSPVYFDLRVIISYPDVMTKVSKIITIFMKELSILCDVIAGVPYTALPIATLVSAETNIPMVIRRKETKQYGLMKLIEGKYNPGDTCLIIEDIISSGSSVLETAKDLVHEGIQVNDAIVLVDREQGGAINIEKNKIKIHSLFKLTQLLNILSDAGKIDSKTVESVREYLEKNQIVYKKDIEKLTVNRLTLPYNERALFCKNLATKKLLNLIHEKKTNLCLAIDCTKTNEILTITEQVGPYICCLKMHIDIIEDFSDGFTDKIKLLSEKYNFLIMEDRKFTDIGNTVQLQYTKGLYKISEWSNFITVSLLSGPDILKGIKTSMNKNSNPTGVFLIGELSSSNNLITTKYIEETLKVAKSDEYTDIVTGIVCQNNLFENPELIQFTPGVKIDSTNDNLGQQYNTPEYVVKDKGADIAVVGRGIIESENIPETAKLYRDRLWQAYCERVGLSNT